MTTLRSIPLSDLKPLRRNPRKATRRSQTLLEQSFEQNGAGRSVLLAANGDILAGNHATETYADIMGNDNVLVVDTDGTQLVAVRRQDIPDANDPRAQRLILADNRASDVADYDAEVLASLLAEDQALVEGYFDPNELTLLLSGLQGDIDYEGSWEGMPDFHNPDVSAPYHLIVHFMTLEAKLAFGKLIQQAVTDKTKFIYYPPETQHNGD